MANTDNKAPKSLQMKITDSDGKEWGTIVASEKTFSTGSKGFYANGKIVNPENGEARYQISGNIILIGSKPEAKK